LREVPVDTPPDENSQRVPPFQEEPQQEVPTVPIRHSALYPKLVQFYGTIGLTVAAVGDRQCGIAVAANAEGCAEAWDELAKQNPAVKRVLETVLQTGAFAAVIGAHLPIALAVVGHHRPELAERFAGFNVAPETAATQGNFAA
jgi:hypothetical protein